MKTKLSFFFSFFIFLSFFTYSMKEATTSSSADDLPMASFEGVPFRLILVDADTNLDIYELRDGLEIDIDQVRNRNLNIRVDLDIPEQSSAIVRVDFKLDGPVSFEQSEYVMPFAAFGDINGNYKGQVLTEGSYSLFTGIDDSPTKDGYYWDLREISFSLGKFELKFSEVVQINSEYGYDYRYVENGVSISYAENPMSFEARAGSFKIGSAHFVLSGPVSYSRIENEEPFTLFGDYDGNFNERFLLEGNYSLAITPYSGLNKQGSKGISRIVNFTVEFIKDDFSLPAVANLYDANTDKSIVTLFTYDKKILDKKEMNLDNVNLAVNPPSNNRAIKSVYMALQGPVEDFTIPVAPSYTKTENVSPFALFGDINGDFNGKSLAEGKYKLYATPYTGANGSGKAGYGRVFEFEIIDTSSATALKAILYPNPASNTASLKTVDTDTSYNGVILDMAGTKVMELPKNWKSDMAIDVSRLKKGIYIIQMDNGKEKIIKKLVVE